MTTTRLFRASLLVLGLAAAGSTAARDAEKPVPSTYDEISHLKPLEVMHMIDGDGTGYVTRKEFMKFQERFFEKMDKDRDGKITEQEWTDQG